MARHDRTMENIALSRFLSAVVLCIPGLASGAAENHGPIRLAEGGTALCSIVQPPDALELEQLAARELADHLAQIVGDRPPIVDAPGERTRVFVGRSVAIERLVPDVDFGALGTDGIIIRTVGDDLVLTGGRPRGVLFAVYTFLQDVVGVRWWAPDALHVPHEPSLTLGGLSTVYRSPFDLRHFRTAPLRDRAFALRMRHNGRLVGYDTGRHSIRELLPAKEHFLEHPDWYMYTPEGDETTGEYSYESMLEAHKGGWSKQWYDLVVKTRRLPSQICPTSAGALEATTAAVLRQLEEAYPKWQYPPKVTWVSQADGRLECKCDQCLQVKEREGTASAVWIEFVNAIARQVAPKYPDVLVATMAFLHTEKPPAHVRPDDNVLVYAIPVTYNRKLTLAEVPRESAWVAKWCEITRNVYIWEHETNFRNWVQPHPNHFVLPRNLGLFARLGVDGVMIQGSYGNAGEFQRMRAWVACQMMWDPRQDERALMEEFLRGYYGDAAPFLMTWIDLQHHAIRRESDLFLSAFGSSTDRWLRLEDLSIGTRLFEQALRAVAGDATLACRVRRARLGIDLVWLERYDELCAAAEKRGQPFLGPVDPHAALEELARDEFHVESYREWADFSEYVGKLREKLGKP